MSGYYKGLSKFDNIEILSGGSLAGLGVSPKGRTWYVDSVAGSNSKNGKTWATAKLTIAAAVAAAAAGDTIALKGSFTEAVTCSLAGVTFVGAGTRPKEAQWTAADDLVCLTIAANYVTVKNIYFKPPAYGTLTNRATSAITLSGANHTLITGCRFQGKTASQAAIYSPVCNSDNVEISDCEFMYMNTTTYGAGILGVEAGGLSYSGWKILRNIFNSCVIAININGRACTITGNTIMEYGINASAAVAAVLALGIDLSGTSSGANSVWSNQLGGTYSATLYKVGASGDNWFGNFTYVATLAPYGLTIANPS